MARLSRLSLPSHYTPPKKLLVAERVVHVVAQRSRLVTVAQKPQTALILCVDASRSVARECLNTWAEIDLPSTRLAARAISLEMYSRWKCCPL